MSEPQPDEDFYTMPDGREDATWMREHREHVASLPLDDDAKRELNRRMDAIYIHTIEERTEEHATEHTLLLTLLRALDGV